MLFSLAALLLSGLLAVKLPDALRGHGLTPEGSYAQAQRVLAAKYRIPAEPVVVLFERPPSVPDLQFHRFIRMTLDRLRPVEGLESVVSPLDRDGLEDGSAAYALLSFRQPSYAMDPVVDELRRRLPEDERMTVRLAGKSVVQADVNRASRQDLERAEAVGIPLAFVVLWFAFGGALAALLPLAAGVAAVTGAMGITYGLGAYAHLELSVFVLNVIPMIGFALSIDFALLMVSRFREELRRRSVREALGATMRTSGRAVFFSAACVASGLCTVLLLDMPMFVSVAAGALVVLALSVLLVFTLLPALLVLTADKLSGRTGEAGMDSGARLRRRWARFVMRRPLRLALLSALLLACCVAPLRQMRLAVPDAASLPRSFDSRIASDAFARHFMPANESAVLLVAEGGSPAKLADRLRRDPLVKSVGKAIPAPIGGGFVLQVTLRAGDGTQEALDWVRNKENEWGKGRTDAGANILIGGEAKYRQEVLDALFGKLPLMLLVLLAANYIVLAFAFRSVLLPIKTIAMNVLGIGASFGLLAWLFEGGRFGLEAGDIAVMIPVYIFGLAFGMSMDYGVFLLSRIAETYRETHDNDRAVAEGLASTSRIITSAAAIMIAVTLPFAAADVAGVKQLGIGIAAAIALDATLIRLVLVPSLMKLLGRGNWWPGRP